MSVVSAKAGIRRASLKAKQIAADNTKTLAQRQEEMALVEAQVKGFQDELDLHDKLNRICPASSRTPTPHGEPPRA